MKRDKIFLITIIVIALLLILKSKGSSDMSGQKTTIYGTMGCGWTRKQLDYMNKNNKPYRFVDCDKENCSNMNAFPTIVHSNGEKTLGYSEF